MMKRNSGLYQLLFALWGLCEGLQASPFFRAKVQEPRADLDSILYLTRHLLGETKKMFHHFKARYPIEGEHILETLPTLAMNTAELANIQVSPGLTKISTDLLIYQRHFDWLKQMVHFFQPLEREFSSIHSSINKLLKRLDYLMARLNLVRASEPPSSPLPVTSTHWSVIHSAHVVFHHFHLFLDFTARALVVIRKKL